MWSHKRQSSIKEKAGWPWQVPRPVWALVSLSIEWGGLCSSPRSVVSVKCVQNGKAPSQQRFCPFLRNPPFPPLSRSCLLCLSAEQTETLAQPRSKVSIWLCYALTPFPCWRRLFRSPLATILLELNKNQTLTVRPDLGSRVHWTICC